MFDCKRKGVQADLDTGDNLSNFRAIVRNFTGTWA